MFWFSVEIQSETFLILLTIQRYIIRNVYGILENYPRTSNKKSYIQITKTRTVYE